MNIIRTALVIGTLLAVTACHKNNTPEPIAPQKNEGVIPQAQLDALNKAKNVENVIMQDANRQREQAEKESQ